MPTTPIITVVLLISCCGVETVSSDCVVSDGSGGFSFGCGDCAAMAAL